MWRAMLYHLLIMSPLLHCGSTACIPARRLLRSPKESNEVFVEEEAANKFIGRHLLFNRFDFEIFTPGNLERECIEEVCNYEEAREVFENIPQTVRKWITDWNLDTEKKHTLLRLVYEALVDCKKSHSTHRTFGKQQWQQLHDTLNSWKQNLSIVKSSLQTLSTST